MQVRINFTATVISSVAATFPSRTITPPVWQMTQKGFSPLTLHSCDKSQNHKAESYLFILSAVKFAHYDYMIRSRPSGSGPQRPQISESCDANKKKNTSPAKQFIVTPRSSIQSLTLIHIFICRIHFLHNDAQAMAFYLQAEQTLSLALTQRLTTS